MPRLGRRLTIVLLLGAALLGGPTAAQASNHVDVREFTVGGSTHVGSTPSLPPQLDDAHRCDVQCSISTQGLHYMTVDVQGPEGLPFWFEYQREGCQAADHEGAPPRPDVQPHDGMGRKVLWVETCDRLTIRPAAVHALADPWKCTHTPAFLQYSEIPNPIIIQKGFWPKTIPILVAPPVYPIGPGAQPNTGPYEAFATCITQHCLVADRAHPCLPNPEVQVTGTVTFQW